MPSFTPLLLLLLLLVTTAAASSSMLFCKCTCFTNSTIIPLPATGGSCSDCNRQFCLEYHLPICKAAKDEDVVTTCFQRDSVKDQVVVCFFIFATVGLLAWALVRPWVEAWVEKARAGMRGYEGVAQ